MYLQQVARYIAIAIYTREGYGKSQTHIYGTTHALTFILYYFLCTLDDKHIYSKEILISFKTS